MPDEQTLASSPARCTTGVPGLDDILHDGLPEHRLYFIQGEPGVGKTTLAMQFLLEGVRRGEPGLYITLSETKEEIEMVARSHGWDLEGLHLFELSNVEEKLRGETENTFLGIVIGPPLDNMQGVLTGVPTFLPEGPLFDNAAKANVAAS